MNQKVFLFLFINFFISTSFSQEVKVLEEVYSLGMRFVTHLKQGLIEGMKNVNPPKDTWIYEKLLKYKKALANDEESLRYGYFIQPSTVNKDTYGFNYYSYNLNTKEYYFATVVTFKVDKENVIRDNAYLFTEKNPLKDWWMNSYSFYESPMFKKVATKHKTKQPPHPPFKE